MSDMDKLDFDSITPEKLSDEGENNLDSSSESKATKNITGCANIVVVGVGGGGNNAVNNMIRAGIKSASFYAMNTDMQSLNMSLAPANCRIQLGAKKTNGLGAGSDPEIGKAAAEESREKIKEVLEGIDLLFITAGMGGGTGTGGAPIVAEIAKSLGILTVAVVTKPFMFEGMVRLRNAESGIQQLKNFVDTLLVIPNQKLLEVLDANVSFKRAFEIADDVLRQGVQGVSDVIANPALINLDFADVKNVLRNKGLAHMGIGFGKGEQRVIEAVRGAVFSPLLETDIEGATGIIVNINGGEDMLLSEVNEACDIIRQVVDPSANIILGTGFVPDKKDIEITIIATGFYDKRNQVQIATGQRRVERVENEAAADRDTADADLAAKRAAKKIEFDTTYNRDLFSETPQEVLTSQNQERKPEEQRSSDVESSRIDVTSKKDVPAFLRRLHKKDN